MRKTGTYQSLGQLQSFIPDPLPPRDPPLDLNIEISTLCGEASFSLGQLNEMSQRLPDPKRFVKAYVLKEALLSSAIEGIHTTLLDVFTQPLSESKPNKETQLVLNYNKALDTAIKMITKEGLPIVSRVILAAHRALMSVGEGDRADPGNYRKQSVRVGNLIPAPAPEVPLLIADLEKYINEDKHLPPLIKAGLAHVQFETIHPFLDGNGRIGRLLIVLMLIESGLLTMPTFYPSYYFKKHQLEYYQKLDRVRTHGDFEGWITFYLKAIRDSSQDAYLRAKDIEKLEQKLKNIIQAEPSFIRMREVSLQALNILFRTPIISTKLLSMELGKTYNTAHSILSHFEKLNIIQLSTQQKRSKLYRFQMYLDLLEKEMPPVPDTIN